MSGIDSRLVEHALELLRSDPVYVEDAREGARVGNSLVGSLLNLELKAPRQYTEAAVREAIAILDREAADDYDAETP